MAHITLDFVLANVGEHALPYRPRRDLFFGSVTNDSRTARPGALFLAIEAERDGHAYIGDARARGALGVLAGKLVEVEPSPDFAYVVVPDPIRALQNVARAHRQRLAMGIVAVTGSVGKTSTKEVIAQVLRHRYEVLASPGNFNNEIGLPIALLEADQTHERAVLEMGAYKLGDIAELCAIALPEIGVITTVGVNHLESFGSQDNVEKGKGELVEALPPTGLAVLNGDDPRARRMASRTEAPVVLYGVGEANVVRAVDLEAQGLDGIAFTLVTPAGTARVETPLIGKHSVYACLAGAAVGLADDFAPGEVAEALAAGGTQPRLRPLPGKNNATVLDDSYNAAPISVLAALDVLAEHDGRRVAILGDMLELGEAEAEGHRAVGARAARSADLLIAVGPRGRVIGQAAEAAGLRDVRYAESGDTVDFTPGARDLVLVKASHGMRLDRVVERLVEPTSPSPGGTSVGGGQG